MKPILLFDIDGTLLHVKRKFLRNALADIMKEQDISPDNLKNISFAGRTDRDIFNELVSSSGSKPNSEEHDMHFNRLKQAYLKVMLNELDRSAVLQIDSVTETIHYLKENGYQMGLCTGNFREIAYKKVEAAGLGGRFDFGGFGCDHADRIHLPGEAHASYTAFSGISPEPERYLVIGDTPNDIRCAKHFGARVVAVTTGSYSEDELTKFQPDTIISSMKNPDDWVVAY
ncbi:HAD family hydrolase [Rhodohalobacter mucosus]|uniref:HAD family hydrolase n=1 Tax=Rhodohalobacter mucosus TaxID=2079485 RepID=UPI00130482FB|nr:HAD hydrolase-like protein [Rhodohalobacter mucosus]